jgi:multidrug efflux pump subunit AcrA (membrane-fusion protein)
VQRAQERVNRTTIRSPIDGVVATPQLENMVGRKVKVGESFIDIVDNSQAIVDVAVTENDVALLRSGEKTSMKLDGFPTRTFHGQVAVVSPRGILQDGGAVFFARVSVTNPDGALRSGMQGRGKISTGWRPAGVVMFRSIGMWIWTKLWNWFGW